MTINFVSLLIATVFHIGLATLWYSRFLFGKKWASLSGASLDEKPAWYVFPLMFVLTLIFVSFFSFLLFFFAPLYLFAILLSLLLWLAFIVPVTIYPILWEKKPWTLFFINGGFYLVSFLCIGTLLYLFQ